LGRLLAIDYGTKRTGIAVTDPLQIIASPLQTVPTHELLLFLKDYLTREPVDALVVGMPRQLSGRETDLTPPVRGFINQLRKAFPDMPVHEEDERFTSVMAQRALVEGGMKRKQRQEKGNVDKVSAAIILQSFLQRTTR
jgi:putative Holliday junction resolvase